MEPIFQVRKHTERPEREEQFEHEQAADHQADDAERGAGGAPGLLVEVCIVVGGFWILADVLADMQGDEEVGEDAGDVDGDEEDDGVVAVFGGEEVGGVAAEAGEW